jgi:hypothetical protein
MANTYSQNFVFNGLGTLTATMPFASLYLVKGKSTIPTLTDGGGLSGLLIVVNKNGSPVYTGQVGAEGFRCTVDCAALDVLTVVFSSSAAADQPLNVIKSTVEISNGD